MTAIEVRERRVQMSGSPREYSRSNVPRAIISVRVDSEDQSFMENMHGIYCEGDQYMLDNSPFYAYGISYGDVVRVDDLNGHLIFASVIKRGGHSTYRVKLPANEDHDYFLRYWSRLGELGCWYEGSSANKRRLYSIDVPPGVDVKLVYGILDELEGSNAWEFEEANYCDMRN